MSMASRASFLAFTLLLFLSTWLRLRKPQVLVLTKSDLYLEDTVSRILSWIEDPYSLLEDARRVYRAIRRRSEWGLPNRLSRI